MAPRKLDLPKAPPVKPSHQYALNNMAEISAAELFQYKDIGFVVLRKRVDGTLVQKARDAVAVGIEDTRKTIKENSIFTTVCEDKNWPSEC
jgi:hypothetical protein